MAVDEVEVKRLFRAKLRAVASYPGDALVAWENVGFAKPTVPAAGDPSTPVFVQEQYRMLSETRVGSAILEALGEALFLVHVPKNRGTEAADRLAKEIADALEAGGHLPGDGFAVILEHTERRPYRESQTDPGWVFKPVATRWRAFTPTIDAP